MNPITETEHYVNLQKLQKTINTIGYLMVAICFGALVLSLMISSDAVAFWLPTLTGLVTGAIVIALHFAGKAQANKR